MTKKKFITQDMFITFINSKTKKKIVIQKKIWEILVAKRLFLLKTVQLAYKILKYIICSI